MKLLAIIAAICAAALSGCSGGVDGPVVGGNRSLSGEDAAVSGEVVIEGRCLYLRIPDTDQRFPVVWPHGTSWDDSDSAIVLSDGTLIREGDVVSGGGGYHSEDFDHYTNAEGVSRLGECVDNTYGEVAVFNSGGEIEVVISTP